MSAAATADTPGASVRSSDSWAVHFRSLLRAAEAERTGERLRRAFLQRAQSGVSSQGGRPFGWAASKVDLHPTEGPLLQQAVRDVTDGVPTRQVARDWNEAGVLTSRGKEWKGTEVRRLLRRPRLAGWRTYRCEIARDATGERVRGDWTPAVLQAEFDSLQAVLDGSGPKQRKGARRYLLTGITRCSTCGGRMHGVQTPKAHAYTCDGDGNGHTLTIAGRQTDALLRALVEQRLAQVDLSDAAPEPGEWAGEHRLREISSKILELMTAFNAGVLTGAIVLPQVQGAGGRAGHAGEAATQGPTQAPTVEAGAFADLDVDRQRAVVESLVEAVVVGKAELRGQPWSPDRVEVVWR